MTTLEFLSVQQATVADLRFPDVYFSPQYGHAVEASDQASWEVAVWKEGVILYPFLRRPTSDDAYFDIVSPYGYAGTWGASDTTVAEWREFRFQVQEVLRERGCIAEFQRIGSLVPGAESLIQSDSAIVVREHNQTIRIPLFNGYESCWGNAESRNRTKTRKAIRQGYTWQCRNSESMDVATGSTFRRLYTDTMKRVGASDYYLFNDRYFQRLVDGFGSRFKILEVLDSQQQVQVSGVFFEYDRLLHLHLVGSQSSALREGAGNLAYDGLIRWGCEQECFDYLHIGGGMSVGDGMYKFKRSFGGQSIPFYIGRSVLDQQVYDQLVANHAYSHACNIDDLRSDIFPLYRSRPRVDPMLTDQSVSERVYLSSPQMSTNERNLLLDAFDSNWIAPLGPHVDAFEREFAAKVQVEHAVALSSGTAALHLALRLLDVGAGDRVLASSLTFAATANAITYVGAKPVFIDSERATWNMDPDLLGAELERAAKAGELPKAMIVVDVNGQCADYEPILKLARFYEIPVIEDAAEALGAMYQGGPAGTFGDIACFSFNGNKIITTSGGGMLVCKRKDWADRARYLASQARQPAAHYEHTEVGYNYRMSNLLAAVGRGQLRVLDDRVKARCQNFEFYREQLGDLPGIEFMPEPDDFLSTRWLTSFTVDPEVFGANREEIRLALEAENIEARPVWKPMHLQPAFAGCDAMTNGVSESLFQNGLCLPSGSSLTESDLHRVVKVVRSQHRGAASVEKPVVNGVVGNKR
ncbi:Putative pyridoxal phosphate-dependent aminotransferase EpsN [Rosistilla ulvae]|uniref:GDP-perosamine synthase n=1 Tax=Rosistilla ulvae TaxID=1930277 RepID=A0A517LX88_9BACT|nr:DegT/DnrJ/EryC1/StrS family aminotransferase [Rosistilla ulvae]QDS87237.1 Putative pyridoxal phosphate-dependent aminotransferase EpsN [Rosistilla ulvae]